MNLIRVPLRDEKREAGAADERIIDLDQVTAAAFDHARPAEKRDRARPAVLVLSLNGSEYTYTFKGADAEGLWALLCNRAKRLEDTVDGYLSAETKGVPDSALKSIWHKVINTTYRGGTALLVLVGRGSKETLQAHRLFIEDVVSGIPTEDNLVTLINLGEEGKRQ